MLEENCTEKNIYTNRSIEKAEVNNLLRLTERPQVCMYYISIDRGLWEKSCIVYSKSSWGITEPFANPHGNRNISCQRTDIFSLTRSIRHAFQKKLLFSEGYAY